MAIKWIKTAHRGLRYYEHQERKHGKKRDRYYSIRFKVDGDEHNYGVGWVSDGVPDEIRKEHHDIGFEEYCLMLLRQYKGNLKIGSGPQSPKENRQNEKAKREQVLADLDRLEKNAVTFDTFFTDDYLPQAENNKKSKTVTREKILYKNWIKVGIGLSPMKTISPFHLEKLKKNMADGGQSPRSIQYALALIRQVFNTAKRLNMFEGDSPTSRVKAPKVDNGRMRFLTREEADKLLNLLKTKSTDVHDMALLALHVGLRFGEIASLTWQDVDLSKSVLTIRDAKAGSRYAFLTPQSADMLKNRTQDKPADYVFQGRNGKLDRMSPTFARAVDELKLNDGIEDPRLQICFHSCRHSYASWMIEQGADLYTVQKLLGHKTNVMTQRYAHLSENRLRDAAAALGAAWQKDLKPEQAISLVK
jgi:integrase